MAVDAGWVWADSLSFDEILPDFRLLAFFLFFDTKTAFPGNVLFCWFLRVNRGLFGLKMTSILS